MFSFDSQRNMDTERVWSMPLARWRQPAYCFRAVMTRRREPHVCTSTGTSGADLGGRGDDDVGEEKSSRGVEKNKGNERKIHNQPLERWLWSKGEIQKVAMNTAKKRQKKRHNSGIRWSADKNQKKKKKHINAVKKENAQRMQKRKCNKIKIKLLQF